MDAYPEYELPTPELVGVYSDESIRKAAKTAITTTKKMDFFPNFSLNLGLIVTEDKTSYRI